MGYWTATDEVEDGRIVRLGKVVWQENTVVYPHNPDLRLDAPENRPRPAVSAEEFRAESQRIKDLLSDKMQAGRGDGSKARRFRLRVWEADVIPEDVG